MEMPRIHDLIYCKCSATHSFHSTIFTTQRSVHEDVLLCLVLFNGCIVFHNIEGPTFI